VRSAASSNVHVDWLWAVVRGRRRDTKHFFIWERETNGSLLRWVGTRHQDHSWRTNPGRDEVDSVPTPSEAVTAVERVQARVNLVLCQTR